MLWLASLETTMPPAPNGLGSGGSFIYLLLFRSFSPVSPFPLDDFGTPLHSNYTKYSSTEVNNIVYKLPGQKFGLLTRHDTRSV